MTAKPAPRRATYADLETLAPNLVGEQRQGSDYPYTIIAINQDASHASVVVPVSPHFVSAFALDRANGNALVWDESDNGAVGYANPVIWTSPYATSASGIMRLTRASLGAPTVPRGF